MQDSSNHKARSISLWVGSNNLFLMSNVVEGYLVEFRFYFLLRPKQEDFGSKLHLDDLSWIS